MLSEYVIVPMYVYGVNVCVKVYLRLYVCTNIHLLRSMNPAVTCPSLVLRVISSKDSYVGATVNVTCPPGQRFGGPFGVVTVCGSDGLWSPYVPDCIGMRLAKLSVIGIIWSKTISKVLSML